ncbi:MAG: serine/threonine-protein kinase [Pirellulaceae bacterium]
MIRPIEDGFDDEQLIAAAEAYDASLRNGEAVSLDFSKQHPDLASVFELLNDVFSPAASPEDSSPQIAPVLPNPLRFGRFQVRSELGRGGYATVYRAYDELLKREVAVKVFAGTKSENGASTDSRLDEARAAARLSHPNIVPVYEVHEEADTIYLVSEFCDGPTLADWLTMHPGHVAVDAAADIVQQLSEAVAHAHARGLVHRDIKPENVMMSPAERRDNSLHFIPRLTDFGLAGDLIDIREPVSPFSLVGTLGFMAPELVLGHQTEPHPVCDVYALGVLMYQMLTGHLPHQATSTLELMKSICTKSIPLPRAIRPMLPADIEAICMKCLARAPAQRYATAYGVADDIARWKRGQSVLARPQSRIEHLLHSARKHPVESSLLATVFVGAVTAAIVLAQLNHRLSDRQQQLRGALSEATHQKTLAETHREAAFESPIALI